MLTKNKYCPPVLNELHWCFCMNNSRIKVDYKQVFLLLRPSEHFYINFFFIFYRRWRSIRFRRRFNFNKKMKKNFQQKMEHHFKKLFREIYIFGLSIISSIFTEPESHYFEPSFDPLKVWRSQLRPLGIFFYIKP